MHCICLPWFPLFKSQRLNKALDRRDNFSYDITRSTFQLASLKRLLKVSKKVITLTISDNTHDNQSYFRAICFWFEAVEIAPIFWLADILSILSRSLTKPVSEISTFPQPFSCDKRRKFQLIILLIIQPKHLRKKTELTVEINATIYILNDLLLKTTEM